MFSRTTILALLVLGLLLLGGCGVNPLAGGDDSDTGTTVAARQSPDDAALAATVRSELGRDEELAGSSIDVVANQGVVTLTGTVPSSRAYLRAISVARQVPGVRPPVRATELTYP